MKQFFKGRVKNSNLPYKDSLIPLYEAITNSIQSIEESNIEGRIDVNFITSNTLFDVDYLDIYSIEIIDNGTGFNQENFDAFQTCDSNHKESIGGKGIGRINWLKAFKIAHIESIYNDTNGNTKIIFDFNEDNGVCNVIKSETSELRKTKISLLDFNAEYREKTRISFNAICDKIIEQFSEYLILGKCPNIYLHWESKNVLINDAFRNEKIIDNQEETLSIGSHSLLLKNMLIKSDGDSKNKVFICAHNRVVQAFVITDIEDIPDYFENNKQGKFVYQGFLSGDILDNDVNAERNNFCNIAFKKPTSPISDDIDIYSIVYASIEQFLKKYIKPYIDDKNLRIKNYIIKEAPEFNHLYRNEKDQVLKIPYCLAKSDEKLYMELVKINQNIVINNAKDVDSILKSSDNTEEEVNKIVNSISDTAKSELTSYVTRRKLIIELLRKLIGQQDEHYSKESLLHNLFIPMKKNSTELNYENHNLWLLDERLAYSYYFYSDKQLKESFTDTDSNERPDGLFMEALSFSNDEDGTIDDLTIVEFKRPGRDDYTLTDNPIVQVYNYIEKIKNKSVLGQNGEKICVSENSKFSCYIVADLTLTLKNVLKTLNINYNEYKSGFIAYNKEYNAYIEILPYKTILSNASKRNKIFFDKLKMD